MIARIWHGYTKPEHADAYEVMLKPELLPGISKAKGYRGSYLLWREAGGEVEFITIMLWDSIDAIRAVAGPDYETAVIPEERRQYLSRYVAKSRITKLHRCRSRANSHRSYLSRCELAQIHQRHTPLPEFRNGTQSQRHGPPITAKLQDSGIDFCCPSFRGKHRRLFEDGCPCNSFPRAATFLRRYSMKAPWSLILRVLALVLFALAAFGIGADVHVNLIAAGLAIWVLSTLIGSSSLRQK